MRSWLYTGTLSSAPKYTARKQWYAKRTSRWRLAGMFQLSRGSSLYVCQSEPFFKAENALHREGEGNSDRATRLGKIAV